MIDFGCPHCRHQMTADDSAAGTVLNCGRCGRPIQLPKANEPLPALPPEDRSPQRVVWSSGEHCWEVKVAVAIGWCVVIFTVGCAVLARILGTEVAGFKP